MSANCCDDCGPDKANPAYKRVLWTVLAVNAAMFAVEIGAGIAAGSASLQADALDFLGDAANYAISLLVVGMALRYRAGEMSAPRLLGKGAGYIAQKIREVARENGIPIVENKPLARLLYGQVDVGREISEALYRAVAEVLAYVYRLRRGAMTSNSNETVR